MANTEKVQVRQIRFNGLRVMSEEQAAKLRVPRSFVLSEQVHENTLLDEIFAPDPVTGNPNSDLYIRLQGDPTMREYIDKYFSQQIPSTKIDESNKDLALEMTKSRYESAQEYLQRIVKYQSVAANVIP